MPETGNQPSWSLLQDVSLLISVKWLDLGGFGALHKHPEFGFRTSKTEACAAVLQQCFSSMCFLQEPICDVKAEVDGMKMMLFEQLCPNDELLLQGRFHAEVPNPWALLDWQTYFKCLEVGSTYLPREPPNIREFSHGTGSWLYRGSRHHAIPGDQIRRGCREHDNAGNSTTSTKPHALASLFPGYVDE